MTKYLCLFVIILFASCTKTLEEIPSNTEIVNGLTIEWRKNVSESKKVVIRSIINDMQFVLGGIFLMGATIEQEAFARENERPAHWVQLSSYRIGKHEITIEQVETILDTKFSKREKENGAPNFSWNDWAYIIKVIRECTNINIDFPTEAQWEYAARGGWISKGYVYPGSNNLEEAEYTENEIGLFNLAKGHSEWCKDAFYDYSNKPLEIDPYYTNGLGRVVRGGNYSSKNENNRYHSNYYYYYTSDDYRACRVSARSYYDDNTQSSSISCRFVINY